MNIEKKKITIELTSAMLGTVPKDPEVYASYIAMKAPIENAEEADAEVETVEKIEEKGWTGFHRDENGIFIYNYMIRGFIKSAIEAMNENGAIKKIAAYKKWIDKMLFINPRRLYFSRDGKPIVDPEGVLERPLRAMTAQGPRVSLARSDVVNEGARLTFEVELFKNNKGLDMDIVMSVFDYGRYVGIGQWRGSGGYGQFKVIE